MRYPIRVGLGIMLLAISGCASLGSMSQKQIANTNSGIIYGVLLNNLNTPESVREACNAAGNKDERCDSLDKYQGAAVASAVGFSAGSYGVLALAPKDMNLGAPCVTGDDQCTYLKVKVEASKFGTVLEIASKPGELKCRWSGLPRAGGAVCDTYHWDYKKDNDAALHF